MAKYDSIIIGSGINSLVAAAMLSKSGRKVLVLESRNEIGGLASTIEFVPGFKCNMVYDTVKWIDPRVLSKLKIESQGFNIIHSDVKRIALGKENQHIVFHNSLQKTADSISKLSENDAANWKEFTSYIKKLTQFLEYLYKLTPPELPEIGFSGALSMRSLLKPFMKHGTRGIVDLIRTAPMMMPEFMDEWFENELLRSVLSTAAIHNLSFGPYASATGYNFLHQHLHCNGIIHHSNFVEGGTQNYANALKNILKANHSETRTNSKVVSIDINNNFCEGVCLENGESIKANSVISGLDPQNTFFKLIGISNLDPNFFTQLRNIKYRGSTARIHFALNELPQISGISDEHMKTMFSICPSMEYLEKASDAVKYGHLSNDPYVEFCIPSLLNSDFSPEGKHVLSTSVQYAPYHLRDKKWDTETKENLKKKTSIILEKVIPGFSKLVESYTVYSPKDLENEYDLTEGNLNHGEMTLDQLLFMRPTISSAQYKTPFKNLYLCGPGTHPGGGLHGTNGFNAAETIIKDKI